ncbi:hypothetical protein IFT73_00775 [Aeromicrobium sp. CFBP 8757]|uniref:hypothetical protein n=1 Tax=Aeromicrobium sp. CFBP 8757 TaxID=2775288 RepID=UPI00178169B7|nr:hypothetical protein [Aeromicrobium sp. CFBP 8757]MBD8605371.1 hypothetical protein [Aeromicrobium sp. CFBP 8757]
MTTKADRKDLEMSVAKMLGVDDVEGPAMTLARSRWIQWTTMEPELAVVDDPADLSSWTRSADYEATDRVLRTLAKLGSSTGHADPAAITALTWALLPGAAKIAWDLSDLSVTIDELVASHLWSTVKTFDWENRRSTAFSILRDTRKGVQAELGVGDGARRSGRTWMQSVCVDEDSPVWRRLFNTLVEDEQDNPAADLLDLFSEAISAGVISKADRALLVDLAVAADSENYSARRGRAGMTGSAAVAAVATRHGLNPRTLRRRACLSLDRLAQFAAAADEETSHDWGYSSPTRGREYSR